MHRNNFTLSFTQIWRTGMSLTWWSHFFTFLCNNCNCASTWQRRWRSIFLRNSQLVTETNHMLCSLKCFYCSIHVHLVHTFFLFLCFCLSEILIITSWNNFIHIVHSMHCEFIYKFYPQLIVTNVFQNVSKRHISIHTVFGVCSMNLQICELVKWFTT